MPDKKKLDESNRRKIEEALEVADGAETTSASHEEMERRWQDKKTLLRKMLERRWLTENQDAITAYNARIERNGVFSHKKKF